MNKAIAHILKEQLAGLPIIDKMAGLVQVAEYQDTTFDENGVKNTVYKRIPISQDVDYNIACEQQDLVPDNSKNGILYFEDNGTRPLGSERGYYNYNSRLRLVFWLNGKNVSGTNYMITPALVTTIIQQLSELNNTHAGVFLGMSISIENIPKADKNIFAPYTYDLYNTQYIMAPYEFAAIDLSVTYKMYGNCLASLTQNPASVCP